jgi:hypothetical protein
MAIQITKLFRPYNGQQLAMAQIHANHYSSNLSHINEMAETLKKDFPQIKDEDIKVHKYGGQGFKGITFVEVQLGNLDDTPKEYDEVRDIKAIL